MSESRLAFSSDDRQRLHRAVCEMLFQAVSDGVTVAAVWPLGIAEKQVDGAFVTLKCEGKLRSCYGCFGRPYALATALEQAAVGAATKDPRFPAIDGGELPGMHVEISLLSNIQPIVAQGAGRPQQVEIGRHGLMIRTSDHSGLLLPRVATDLELNAEQFLAQVCVKAGLPPKTWLDDDCELHTFEADCFGGMYVPAPSVL